MIDHTSSSGHVSCLKLESEVIEKRVPLVSVSIKKNVDKIEGAICRLIRTAYTVAKKHLPNQTYQDMCELQICNDTLLTSTLYQDHHSYTEFREIISHLLDETLLEKLRLSPALGIMIDESTDLSLEKHLIVYVNYLENGKLRTSYLTLLKLVSADSNAVYSSLVGYLRACKIDMSKLFGFSSDSAAVMMGKENGVAAKLKRQWLLA